MDIKEVFGAEPKSTWHILCETGMCLYIPAYQRDYNWDKENIERLFDDARHGLKLLVESNDSIIFIGTLITVHDTKYQTIHPLVKGEVPAKVMLVIDGQQRLTTLLLINALLHTEVSSRADKLKKSEDAHDKWLYQESVKLQAQLIKTLEEDMNFTGDEDFPNFQWYPRMIRAYDDSWSRYKINAKYTSPVAAYLHGYGSHVRDGNTKHYNHEIPDVREETKKQHEFLLDKIGIMKKQISYIAKPQGKEIEMPLLSDMARQESFQEILFNMTLPMDVASKLMIDDPDKKTRKFQELFRIIAFAKYVLERMAVTVVTVKNETYAFDMFEALNTTGEPLTAYETFKPRVIDSEKLDKYEISPSKVSMDVIAEYLGKYKGAQEKQNATSRMLVPFALSETGKKLSKRLSEQRRYLNKEQFDAIDKIENKRDFVDHLAHASIFVNKIWTEHNDALPDFQEIELINKDIVLMCLDFLKRANHSITIGILMRFFSNIISENDPSKKLEAILEFEGAVKAVTAFFVLWRGSRESTDNIDSHYRELMRFGKEDKDESVFILPLCRRPEKKGASPVDSKILKTGLRHYLTKKGNINNIDDWMKGVEKSSNANLRTLVKFILLIATHDTCPDKSELGLPKYAREGYLTLFNFEHWQRLANEDFTIEHIYPQSRPVEGWDNSLFEEFELIDTIGNLTLLPSSENSSAGNKSWTFKRMMFDVLSSPSKDDIECKVKEAKKMGLELKTSTQEILQNSQYLPHVKAISMLNEEWNADFIKKRSRRIAELSWNTLSGWLEE